MALWYEMVSPLQRLLEATYNGTQQLLRCRAYLNGDADIVKVHLIKPLCICPDCCITLLSHIFNNWLHLRMHAVFPVCSDEDMRVQDVP
jgi:hypothetical protein